jgi:hypothetical protein
MRRKCHSKHNVLYGCKHVPRSFFERVHDAAWLAGVEIELRSRGRISVRQTKEKYGATTIYFSHKEGVEMVNVGKVMTSPVWLAYEEGLLPVNEEEIPEMYYSLMRPAVRAIRGYLKTNKTLPSGRIFYGFSGEKVPISTQCSDQPHLWTFSFDGGSAVVSSQVPKVVEDALERQRRLNPSLAHYIYYFSPRECDCPNDYEPCRLYRRKATEQDRRYVGRLREIGGGRMKYRLLRGGFVV